MSLGQPAAPQLMSDAALLAAIVESSEDAIISKGLDGRILTWNAAAEAMYGYTAVEAIGQPITIIIPPEKLDEEREIIARIRRGERLSHFETVRRAKDGTLLDISVSVSPIHAPDGTIVGAAKIARDISERKRAAHRQKLLSEELDHRVRNNLAAVLALATQSLNTSETLDGFRHSFTGRLRAMAQAHALLARNQWDGVALDEIVRVMTEPYHGFGETPRVRWKGPGVMLPSRMTGALSLALHELLTNAVKYGSLSVERGTLGVEWRADAGELVIDWTERDGPAVSKPTRQGSGSMIVHGLITYELRGRLEVRYEEAGLVCMIAVPVEREAAAGSGKETEGSHPGEKGSRA